MLIKVHKVCALPAAGITAHQTGYACTVPRIQSVLNLEPAALSVLKSNKPLIEYDLLELAPFSST